MLRFPVKCARLRQQRAVQIRHKQGGQAARPPFFSNFFLFCHISELALRVPLVFTKKHGIYAAKRMLRLRLVFANRTYYTMMPRRAHKTAPAAVFAGFNVLKAHAQKAHRRTKCAQPRAQAAGLSYYMPWRHKSQQNRACRGFAWFQCSPSPCAKAHRRTREVRVAAQAAGLGLLYHGAAKRSQQNRACRGFAWFNVLKPMRKSASARSSARSRASGRLELLYHENRGKEKRAFSCKIKRAAQNVPPAAVQEKPHALSTVFPPAAPFPAKGRRQAAARAG